MTQGIMAYSSQYEEYLRDESRMCGFAESISFPQSTAQACEQISALADANTPVTVQGGRTGICGAAVPAGGHILNLTRLKRITGLRCGAGGTFLLTVQPGVLLQDLQTSLALRSFDTEGWSDESLAALKALRCADLRFAPNPTEGSATIGGAFACNAQGLNAMSAGHVGDHVEAIEVCLPNGRVWNVERGTYRFGRTGCPLPDGGWLPAAPVADPVSFYGLVPRAGMDLVDLFAGAEGMLGAVLSLTLRLTPAPARAWGVLFFFSGQQDAAQFSMQVPRKFEAVRLAALEFFDRESIRRAQAFKAASSRLRQIPDVPADACGAVYLELEGEEEEALEAALLTVSERFEAHGGREDDTWAGFEERELEKFRLFRHTVPEAANAAIDAARQNEPSITKVCADFTLPRQALPKFFLRYEADIAASGIPGMVFGHVACGRLHVNLLPAAAQEYAAAQKLIEAWAHAVQACGGLLAGENGVGKKKKHLLGLADPAQLAAAKTVKAYFDPENRWNPGNYL